MKTIHFFLFVILCGTISAQVPQSFRYQAVARDNSGNVLANQSVSFRIGILSGSISGTSVYSETHTGLTTNAFGLVELEIGKGTPVTGMFSSINWSSSNFFVKIEMDPAGGSLYQVLSTSQLLSVPYALFAKDVENNNDADASPLNEIQTLTLSGNTLGITNGNSVDLPEETGDNWGNQVVVTDASLTGNGLTSNPLKIPDNAVTSSKIQDGAVSSTDLADNAVTGAKVQDGTIATADLSNLAVNNEKLAAASVTTDKINNSAVTSDKLAANAVTSAKIAAGAVTGDKIAQAGATSGQALKWNGTTWAPATDATVSGGWVDDGTTIHLNTSTDTVVIGTVNKLGKLNVDGDIGMKLTKSIYFGSDETRISSLSGGDLRFVAEDLSVLTTEDITFGHFGDETWIKFDNAHKRVGLGTLSPTDRFHSILAEPTAGLSAVKGVANPTNVLNYGIYGESKSATGYGVFGKSPKYGVYGTATETQGRGIVGEATGTASIGVHGIATNTSSTGVWGEGANQGVYGFSSSATGKGVYGKVTSATGYSGYFEGGKFYVKGSAEIRDTLFADALQVANSPRVVYEKFSLSRTVSTLNSWGPMDTITLVAPGPGFVMLNFSGTLFTNHTYLEGTWVGVGISTSPTGGVLAQVWWEFEHQLVGGYYQSPCAVNAVATVSSAGTKKYYIVSYHWGTSADEDVVHLNHGSFSALFIPSP